MKKSTIWNFVVIVLYKIVLDLSYLLVISKLWAYTRFYLNLNVLKLVESYLLLFVVFILMPKSSRKLSHIFIWLLVLLSYVPLLTLFAFMDEPRTFVYAVTGFWVLVFLLLKTPLLHIPSIKKSQSQIIYYIIFIFLSIAALFLMYKYFGFSFNFNLTKIYEIRSQYKEIGISMAFYLFTWLAYVINPISFAFYINKKRWLFAGLIVVFQIFLFSNTGEKTFLFALPFTLILMWIVSRKNPLAWIATGLSAIILLGILSYYLIGDIWISSLFTRRSLLVPAQLSFFYYDFFSKNGLTFLSQHHIFRNFINYPYHLAPPYLIGEVYFNRPEMSANNGIYGDAYMNFGFIGFVLWAFLLAIILKLIDSFSKNKKITATIAAIAMPSIFLINSAFLTSLATHGLLLSLIVLYLLPKE